MTQVWFALPDGKWVASQLVAVPRRGDVVRLASDGEAYEVAQIEHIATFEGRKRRGMRYGRIVVRLSAGGDRGGTNRV